MNPPVQFHRSDKRKGGGGILNDLPELMLVAGKSSPAAALEGSAEKHTRERMNGSRMINPHG